MGTHKLLGWSESGTFSVRALREQKPDTFFADVGHFMYIRILPIDRGHIKFKITSMHNRSFRRIKDDTQAIRNAVIGVKEGN
ncbi:hypothetical protein D3C75_757450 [compost metagenome]